MRSFDAPHSGVSPRGKPRNAVAGWRGAARARNRVGHQRVARALQDLSRAGPKRTEHRGPTRVTATYLNGQEDRHETHGWVPALRCRAAIGGYRRACIVFYDRSVVGDGWDGAVHKT